MTEDKDRLPPTPHPLFDPQYYRDLNPDLPAHEASFGHYLSEGWRKLRSPHPLFSVEFYLSSRPDVRAADIEPLGHFIRRGWKEATNPHPLFNIEFYLSQVDDLAGLDPLSHYVTAGRAAGLKANDCAFRELPIIHGEKRVVIIDSIYPTPDRDSGSLDCVNFIRIFQSLGYKIYFIAAAQFDPFGLESGAMLAREKLAALDVIVVDKEYALSIMELLRLKGGYFEIAFLSRVYCGGEFFEQIKTHAAETKIIFNTVDLHHIRERREAELAGNLVGINNSYWSEARETFLARLSDATIVVSQDEVEALKKIAPGARIYLVPLIREIPGRGKGYAERADIAFIGGFKHQPNIDAVRYFLDRIWPLVRVQMPDLRFRVIGADMPAEILNRRDEGLDLIGYVPDLSQALSDLRLTVAPLRYGAGAKGKVASSLAHGVPCVGTPIATEGMGLGEESGVLIASNPDDFARRIIEIYSDASLWDSLSRGGVQHMRLGNSIDAGTKLVKRICDDILPMHVQDVRP